MKSLSVPTDSDVSAAVAMILSSPAYAAYFFDRLENPNWIAPLNAKGLFSPPEPESIDGGGVRYPIWPASRYLARMASHAPDQVAEIARAIKTENPAVLRDILDAAANMPVDIAATLVPTVCRAINTGIPESLSTRSVEFCAHLANGGQVDAALELSEELFLPRFGRGPDELDPRDEYWYSEGLKEIVPLLAPASPGRFLPNLCVWLNATIALKRFYGERPPTDGSDHWRPAIEEHAQNRAYDLGSNFVGIVRAGFELAIESGNIELRDALEILTGQGYNVFARLRVHLINRFAERASELARATMMSAEFFEASELWLWHEYAMLMHRCFPMLLPEEQAAWLDRIDRGPRTEELYFGTGSAGQEALEDYRRKWRAIRLHWIVEHLSGEHRSFYESVTADWENRSACDFHFYSPTPQEGWRSPISVDELAGLGLTEALDKISALQSNTRKANAIEDSTEALAMAFGQYVSGNAEALSRQAEAIERREPVPIYIFVRTFIEQMAEAAKAVREIDVTSVLRLCSWVVDQPISGFGAYIPVDGLLRRLVDKDWQWARDAVSRFIREICGQTPEGSPRYPIADHRQAIAPLLGPLTENPAKSLAGHEVASRGASLWTYDDFLTAAINTPRGIALDATVDYARWIANHLAREQQGRRVVVGGFDVMTEVRETLDWQIAPDNASFEAFAVIGAHFGLLYWIDEEWVAENAGRIFDLSQIEREPATAYGCAAWNSFLNWGQAHISYYRVLRSQYVYAVENLSNVTVPPNSGRTPVHQLGEHLILLYGRGHLNTHGLDDEHLLFSFLESAGSNIRSQTIAFVGATLRQSEAVSETILKRFQSLWEWYWKGFGEKDVSARPASGLFASWFRCEQFPIAWRLEQLEAVVELPHVPEMAELLVERLAEAAEASTEHVAAATRILDRMVRADNEGWRAYAWRQPAMRILKVAVQGGGAERDTGVELIDHLGRRGFYEFGKLLRLSEASSERV